MAWRVAKSLDQLLGQINAKFPTRNKASDGGIGDESHENRASDHNPWYGPGIVTARDFTHDPGVGLDMHALSDQLKASRDPRIKYVIFDHLIMDTRPHLNPWVWVPYHGPNPHTAHLHLSVVANPLCDDTSAWSLPLLATSPAPPPPPVPVPTLPVHAVGSRLLRLASPYMVGTDVQSLQRVLNRWYPLMRRLVEDGVYGPATRDRVLHLQRNARIAADGIVGRQTFGVLGMR